MLKAIKAWLYFRTGVWKIKQGKYIDAVRDFDKSIQLKPNYAIAYYNRGWLKGQLHEFGAGIADLDEALRMKPRDAHAYFLRGTLKSQCNQFDAAIADLDEAIRLKPDYSDAYAVRDLAVEGIAGLDRIKQSLQLLDKSLRLEDDEDNSDTPPQSIEEFLQRLENNEERLKEDNPSMYHLASGGAYAMNEEYESAIIHFNTAIQLNPNYAEAYASRGKAKFHLGKFAEAIADCDTALRLQPPANADDFRSVVYLSRAQAKANLKQYESAIVDFDESIRLTPEDASAYFYRGVARCGLEKNTMATAESIKDFDMAMKLAQEAGDGELQEKIRTAMEVFRPKH